LQFYLKILSKSYHSKVAHIVEIVALYEVNTMNDIDKKILEKTKKLFSSGLFMTLK